MTLITTDTGGHLGWYTGTSPPNHWDSTVVMQYTRALFKLQSEGRLEPLVDDLRRDVPDYPPPPLHTGFPSAKRPVAVAAAAAEAAALTASEEATAAASAPASPAKPAASAVPSASATPAPAAPPASVTVAALAATPAPAVALAATPAPVAALATPGPTATLGAASTPASVRAPAASLAAAAPPPPFLKAVDLLDAPPASAPTWQLLGAAVAGAAVTLLVSRWAQPRRAPGGLF